MINGIDTIIFAGAVYYNAAKELCGTVIPQGTFSSPFGQFTLCRTCVRLSVLCSSTLSVTLRNMSEKDTRSRNPTAVPRFRSGRTLADLRRAKLREKGKRDVTRGWKTAGCLPSWCASRGVSAISLALQAAKCDSSFAQSAQTTTPSGGAAMPKACFSSNYSVSQPVPPAGKFSFYGIIVPQFFRRFLHKMMKDFSGNTAQLKLRRFAEILCPDFVAISR